MKKGIVFMVMVALLIFPVVSYGGFPKACAVTDTGESGTTAHLTIVSNKDQPCYAGGKYVGNCSRNQPYYHVFSGVCYTTLAECKKADGDLSGTSGSGGCVRCGR